MKHANLMTIEDIAECKALAKLMVPIIALVFTSVYVAQVCMVEATSTHASEVPVVEHSIEHKKA